MDHTLTARLRAIRLLAMDVDGVLTEGGIAWGQDSEGRLFEFKVFCVKDGLGLHLVREAGLEVAWFSGRASAAVERRAAELHVRHLHQRVRDKGQALRTLAAELQLDRSEVLYIGDDLNDLPAFEAAGVTVAVANAAASLRERADWVTQQLGGRGAVREVVEAVLRAQGRWDGAVRSFLDSLREEEARPAAEPPPQ